MSWQREHAELEPSQAPRHERTDQAAPLHELVSSVGNRAFARQVDGILPSGQVHPAVQSEIDATRGGGASLDGGVQDRFSGSLGDLSDVRAHRRHAGRRRLAGAAVHVDAADRAARVGRPDRLQGLAL